MKKFSSLHTHTRTKNVHSFPWEYSSQIFRYTFKYNFKLVSGFFSHLFICGWLRWCTNFVACCSPLISTICNTAHRPTYTHNSIKADTALFRNQKKKCTGQEIKTNNLFFFFTKHFPLSWYCVWVYVCECVYLLNKGEDSSWWEQKHKIENFTIWNGISTSIHRTGNNQFRTYVNEDFSLQRLCFCSCSSWMRQKLVSFSLW